MASRSAPARPMSSVPARAAPAPPAHPPPGSVGQPRQPGLMAQMATTAAGVAVGSAVGHTIGHAMTGGGGGQQQEVAPTQAYSNQPAYVYPNQPQDVAGQGPCQVEMKQFLECAQNQADITLCQGFNEALRQCKISNGLQYQ